MAFSKKQILVKLESLQRYYIDGDGFDNSGGWMTKEDNSQKGEWISVEDINEIIKLIKSKNDK